MPLDLTAIAADIARNVGREFPAPSPEMALRQYLSLAEETRELTSTMLAGGLAGIREELADAAITIAMLANYITPAINLGLAEASAFPAFNPTYPDIQGAVLDVAGPLRRYLGIARRSGTIDPVITTLGLAMLTVRQLATNHGIDLDGAIEAKAETIFARGWREVAVSVPDSGL